MHEARCDVTQRENLGGGAQLAGGLNDSSHLPFSDVYELCPVA